MKILVFGNPLVQKDSVALKIMPELQRQFPQIEFVEFDTAEDLQNEGKQVLILDAVEGLKKSEVITDLDRFEKASRNLSMHDFDLYQNLQILRKLGTIEKVTIIGIPTQQSRKKALKESKQLIDAITKPKS